MAFTIVDTGNPNMVLVESALIPIIWLRPKLGEHFSSRIEFKDCTVLDDGTLLGQGWLKGVPVVALQDHMSYITLHLEGGSALVIPQIKPSLAERILRLQPSEVLPDDLRAAL